MGKGGSERKIYGKCDSSSKPANKRYLTVKAPRQSKPADKIVSWVGLVTKTLKNEMEVQWATKLNFNLWKTGWKAELR
jgi:ribosomal protein L31E